MKRLNQMIYRTYVWLSAATIAVLIGLIIASIVRPIYLWHGSAIMTRDGSRLFISDGVLMIHRLETSGPNALRAGSNISQRMILQTSRHPDPFSSAPADDDRTMSRLKRDESQRTVIGPRLVLYGSSWKNFGGYERAYALIGTMDSRTNAFAGMTISVFCVPLWFGIATIGGGLGIVLLITWMRRRQRAHTRGFAVSRFEKLLARLVALISGNGNQLLFWSVGR